MSLFRYSRKKEAKKDKKGSTTVEVEINKME